MASSMMYHYVLVDRVPVVEPDLMKWASWFETADRVVRHTYTEFYFISTVFLGLDHSFGDGPSLLFETMSFGKDEGYGEVDMNRYHTWDQAEIGHDRIVRECLKREEIATNMVIFPRKEKT